jgi:uncharacterized phage protein (TIGR02218 family)
MHIAECFTFNLKSGSFIYCTTADVDIVYGGHTFSSDKMMVSGLKYKSTIGLNADEQEVDLYYRSTDMIDGSPIAFALSDGAFDLCKVQRDRVFFSDHIGGSLVGGVTLFSGRIVRMDEIGRTTTKMTVADDLIILNNAMPRNVYSNSCNHVLYDAGCTADISAHSVSTTVGDSSTASIIFTTVAALSQIGGFIRLTSGLSTGLQMTIKQVVAGVRVELLYPLLRQPSPGDTIIIAQGCDHTIATCTTKFSNSANFRGFPYVPPPQFAA